MKKSITVVGVVALVLALAAGATATTRLIVRNANLATGSVNSRVVADNSLGSNDLQKSVRDAIAVGAAPVTESRLDAAVQAKVDHVPAIEGVLAARVQAAAGAEQWLGVTFPAPLATAFDKTKLVVKYSPDTSAQCRGTVDVPSADPGYLCVYLDPGATGNAASFGATPIGTLGMRFEWKATTAGLSTIQGSYAYTPAA
jgi:hypothetical protein